jgi:sporulation protein YlmC with PRC-barrel domain
MHRPFILTTMTALIITSTPLLAQHTPDHNPPSTPPTSARPGDTPRNTNVGANQTAQSLNLQRLSKLIGKNVEASGGDNVGEIKDLALDTTNGCVSYAVFGYGGTLGMGDKLVAIPLKAFQFRQNTGDMDDTRKLDNIERVVLNVDKAKLQMAPTFDKDHWPTVVNYDFWGITDADMMRDKDREADNAKPAGIVGAFVKASDAVGMDLQNPQGEDLGEVQDLVVDLRSCHIAYAVLATGGVLGVGEKYHAVPWQTLYIRPSDKNVNKQVAFINIDKDRLKAAPTFAKNAWPNMADEQWSRTLHAYYGAQPTWVYGYSGAGDDMGGWDKDTYFGKYDTSATANISGKVTNVQRFTPTAGMSEGVMVTVMDDKTNRSTTIHLGPASFVERQPTQLKVGDQITIMGARASVNGQDVIIAREIQSGGQTIRLRDQQGKPAWTGGMKDRKDTGTNKGSDSGAGAGTGAGTDRP